MFDGAWMVSCKVRWFFSTTGTFLGCSVTFPWNFYFAQSCKPPLFMCLSTLPLCIQLIPSAYFNRLASPVPRLFLFLASTLICCKWVQHTLHVRMIILSSSSTSQSKSSCEFHFRKVFLVTVSFYVFFSEVAMLSFQPTWEFR